MRPNFVFVLAGLVAIMSPVTLAAPVPTNAPAPSVDASTVASPSATRRWSNLPPIPGLTEQFGDYRGRFSALIDPKPIKAAALTDLDDDEEVLGLTFHGESRAYPLRFIAWHHMVNDTVAGHPVLVTYCSVCNSGVAFDPEWDGKRHLFDVFGLYRGVMAMYDKSNNTIYAHIAGEAVFGPDKGKSLTAFPVVNVTWGEWKKLHPQTTTPNWDAAYRKYYQERVASGMAYMPPGFAETMKGLRDSRLASNALVLGVRIDGKERVYPYDTLEKAADVVQETVAGTPIVCFYTPTPQTGAAFDRRLDGATLDFTRNPDDPTLFRDKGTHSNWTIEGACVSGNMQGKQLTRVYSLQAQWYGWSAYFPETTIYSPFGLMFNGAVPKHAAP